MKRDSRKILANFEGEFENYSLAERENFTKDMIEFLQQIISESSFSKTLIRTSQDAEGQINWDRVCCVIDNNPTYARYQETVDCIQALKEENWLVLEILLPSVLDRYFDEIPNLRRFLHQAHKSGADTGSLTNMDLEPNSLNLREAFSIFGLGSSRLPELDLLDFVKRGPLNNSKKLAMRCTFDQVKPVVHLRIYFQQKLMALIELSDGNDGNAWEIDAIKFFQEGSNEVFFDQVKFVSLVSEIIIPRFKHKSTDADHMVTSESVLGSGLGDEKAIEFIEAFNMKSAGDGFFVLDQRKPKKGRLFLYKKIVHAYDTGEFPESLQRWRNKTSEEIDEYRKTIQFMENK